MLIAYSNLHLHFPFLFSSILYLPTPILAFNIFLHSEICCFLGSTYWNQYQCKSHLFNCLLRPALWWREVSSLPPDMWPMQRRWSKRLLVMCWELVLFPWSLLWKLPWAILWVSWWNHMPPVCPWMPCLLAPWSMSPVWFWIVPAGWKVYGILWDRVCQSITSVQHVLKEKYAPPSFEMLKNWSNCLYFFNLHLSMF